MVNENQPVLYVAFDNMPDMFAVLKALQEHKVVAVPYVKADGSLGFRKIDVHTVYRTQ